MKRIYVTLYILFILLSLCGVSTAAEKSFMLHGRVVDATNDTPLVGATIVNESGAGVITDIDGNFKIYIADTPTKLEVDFMGYAPEVVNITALRQNITISLKSTAIAVENVVVKGRRRRTRDEYAWYIHGKIVENSDRNNPDKISPLNYSDYERSSIFYLRRNKAAKADTLAEPYSFVPIVLNEKVTHDDRKEKGSEKEVVTTKSNVLLESMSGSIDILLRQKIAVDMNFYDDQINLLGRGFPSPLAQSASLYYRMYLLDSVMVDGSKRYRFRYYPKSKRSTTFIGNFSVDADTWAITEIEAELPNSANLNFVSNFSVKLTYKPVEGRDCWFRDKQHTKMDLTLTGSSALSSSVTTGSVGEGGAAPGGLSELLHFRLQRNNSYTVIDDKHRLAHHRKMKNEDAVLRMERRKMPMNSAELAAESEIDVLKQNRWSKVLDKATKTVVSAHLNLGAIDVGPYFGLYRNTVVEGPRASIPLRTSEKLFKNFSVGGYLAYASALGEFGWNANAHYRVTSAKRRCIISTEAYDDYFDLGQNRFVKFVQENPYNQGTGNFLSSLTIYRPNPYMIRRSALSLSAEYELADNLGLLVRPAYERYNANVQGLHYTPYIQFNRAGHTFRHFDTRSMMVDLRYSKDQSYEDNFFDRIYYGNEHPIFHATLIGGEYNLDGGRGDKDRGYYAHANLIMKWRKVMGPVLMVSLLEGGCILGDVPYPLLDLPRGSGDMGSARYHYNLLDHASVASDAYAHAHLALNFGGIVLGKLPLIRTLNMREVVGFKAYYGSLRSGHNGIVELPSIIHAPSAAPYMECSVGVSNIFQFLRVEYVRGLSPDAIAQKYAFKEGIKVRMEIVF